MRIVALSRLKEKDRIESDCCNLIVSSSKTRFRSCFALDLIRATIRLTRDWRPDVIVSQEPLDDGIVALVMSKVLKTRFITQLHYDFLDKYWVGKTIDSKLRTIVSICVLKCADHIRTVSEKTKNDLVLKLGIEATRVTVVPPAMTISGKNGDARKLQDIPIVYFVGRMVKEKNLALWMEAASIIRSKCRFDLDLSGMVLKC